MVVKDGVIADFGDFAEVSAAHPGVQVTHIKDRLILPGFIDGHIHFPQVRVLGAYGEQLLDWLQNWIFPEELKYSDRNYARDAAAVLRRPPRRRHDDLPGVHQRHPGLDRGVLRRGGPPQHAGHRRPDRHRPLRPRRHAHQPENFYRETKRLIEQYHRKGRNLYAITPRFAVGVHRR